MNSFVHMLLEYSAHLSSGQIPSSGKVGLLGQTIIAFVILVDFAQLSSVVFLPLCTLTTYFSTGTSTKHVVGFWDFFVSFQVKNGILVFLFASFQVSEVEHLFMCLRSFCVSFLLMPVSLESFSFVGLSLICRGPYITKISPLYVLWVSNIFFPSLTFIVCLYVCVCMVFLMQKSFLLLCSQIYPIFLLWLLDYWCSSEACY